MTDGGCGRAWREAEGVENVRWVSGNVTWSVRAFAASRFAGEPEFCAHVPPLIKNCADTGCVKIIAAMIPKTTPLICNSNPKYNRDFFKV